ncbi:MAG: cytochrome b N-terminal domain-containing protein [Fibrobacteria bacterium]|nr:cytochrome b N-terminal domain-containing protein [Fibrobacteria bacterium]
MPESLGPKVYSWLDERLGLSPILELALKKRVPDHKHSFWYYWGGITLFFFIVMCFTGVLLLLYYRPGDGAYESVQQINTQIKFGWLIRSIHSWSANLMVAAAFVHMFSTFFMKAYRAPREFLWWSGFGLLSLAMVFGFSGYLLPMDDLAYFATKVGLSIPAVMPVVGPWIADLVRGGPDITAYTISRFFALHVVILPALFIPLLLLHLGLVQQHGMSIPESEQQKPEAERKSIPFFPNFVFKDLAVWLVALNVLALLAVAFPWPLGPAADPLAPAPADIHPEWYFMSSFQILKAFGGWFPGVVGEFLGIAFFNAGVVLWALVPLFDPNTKSGQWGRRVTWFGFVVLAVLIVTTIWGYAVLPAVAH